MRRADLGKSYSRTDLVYAVAEFFDSLPKPRRIDVPFKHSVPGPDFIRGFIKRCDDCLSLGRPGKESEERWRSCNGDTFTNHIATFESIVEGNDIDGARIFKLDETEVKPNKDKSGRSP